MSVSNTFCKQYVACYINNAFYKKTVICKCNNGYKQHKVRKKEKCESESKDNKDDLLSECLYTLKAWLIVLYMQ